MGLRIVMWMVCVFHVVMGIGLNLSTDFVDSAAQMYGAEVAQWSPQFLYILRPLGVFMAALGCLAAIAALKPLQHRGTIYVFAGIFIARALQRAFLGVEVSETFGIAASRNAGNMIFFFALAAVLIVLDQLAHRDFRHGSRGNHVERTDRLWTSYANNVHQIQHWPARAQPLRGRSADGAAGAWRTRGVDES